MQPRGPVSRIARTPSYDMRVCLVYLRASCSRQAADGRVVSDWLETAPRYRPCCCLPAGRRHEVRELRARMLESLLRSMRMVGALL